MKSIRVFIIVLALTFGYGISAQTFFTTKTGEKYHKGSCHYLKHSKKEIDLEKAKTLGYLACKVCKPLTSISKSNALTSEKESKPTASKKTVATQCVGKTKSGSRCKRKTKNANSRCYQH